MDSESDEGKYYASADTKDEEERRPTSRRCSNSRPPSPDFSFSSSQDGDNNDNVAGQQPQPSQWTLPPKSLRRVVLTFSAPPPLTGKKCSCTHDREYTPPNILLLLFSEVITFLVVETNRYYSQFLDNSDDGASPQREVTEVEMFASLALTLQIGHAGQGGLKEQLNGPFYEQTIVRARYYHILRFLLVHFTDNNGNGVDRTDDRLWTMRELFEILRMNFSKFYKPCEHLAV